MVFLENELLYGTAFPMSDEAQSKDFVLPLGKAKIEKEGADVTIVAFSKMVEPPSLFCRSSTSFNIAPSDQLSDWAVSGGVLPGSC